MKAMKRILAIALILVMVLAMMPAAMAADGTITINNTVSNATYRLYKMFTIEPYADNVEGTNYYYRPTDAWLDFFSAGQNGALYGTVTNGYVIWENLALFSSDKTAQDAAVAAFVSHAKGYAAALAADKTVTTTGTSITLDGLDVDAYYLVVSSIGGTALAGPVGTSGLTINEKNSASEAPTITKTVGPNDAEYMSVDIGSEFNFKVVITLNEAVSIDTVSGISATFTDVMPKHIEVTAGSLVVSHKSGDVTNTLAKDTDYAVIRNVESTTEATTHQVDFKKNFAAGDVLTLTYTAKMVKVGDSLPTVHEMYTNLAKVAYGDKSVSDTASVFTLAVNGYKYYVNDTGVTNNLAGAEFVLKNSEDKYYKRVDAVVSWVGSKDDADVVVSDSNGVFSFIGIASGTYTLEETKAPDGYTGAGETQVTVDRDLKEVRVENIKGTNLLPSTGGMGTTIFYALGSVLVLGAVVVLLMKKRGAAE